jgi:hypothetical protein
MYYFNLLGELSLTKHKVFVSYQHANDQYYREAFETLFTNIHDVFISKSVQIGEIDPRLSVDTIRHKIRDEYLRDSTVTVVLIGSETWKRKHVDWEISSSIRNTSLNPRSGLIGIHLPYHPNFGKQQYDPGIVPPRLVLNDDCGYAKIFSWSDNPVLVARWIDEAFKRRKTHSPDNSYEHFGNNKFSERWC